MIVQLDAAQLIDLIDDDGSDAARACLRELLRSHVCAISTGFLIYASGVTRRSFHRRFREHTRAYRSGVYTVFDAASRKRGVRQKIWPGFWFAKRAPAMQQRYERSAAEINDALQELLSTYRIFVAPLAPVPRVLERIETAIMNALYSAGGVAAEIPDRGMALAPRWQNERGFRVRNITPVLMHGLPTEFDA